MSKKRLVTVNRGAFEKKSRVFGYEFGVMLCELLPRYQGLFQSDFSKVLIMHAVGVATVSRLMSRPEAESYENVASVIPPEMQVPVNALSIADSTGIPRETVRRKIKELIVDGFLVEDERGGYRMKPGALVEHDVLSIYLDHLQSLTTLLNRSIEAGLLRIEDGEY